jgi:DUF1016 N-terminal domain
MNFDTLITSISTTDRVLQTEAVKAINKALTTRNWLIGLYIVEFEQHGEDKAKYGSNLLQKISEQLDSKSLSYRNLRLFRQFYLEYRTLAEPIKSYIDLFYKSLRLPSPIWQSMIAKLQISDIQDNTTTPFRTHGLKRESIERIL